MQEGGKASIDSPREGWARSLRRETALQDQYRRAIHAQSGIANAGFDRYTVVINTRGLLRQLVVASV